MPEAQYQVQGERVMYVTIALPTSAGDASTLEDLIAAGTEHSTATTPTGTMMNRIMGVMLRDNDAYHYGGGATTVPIAVAADTAQNEPATQYHKDTYVRNQAASTGAAIAVCLLRGSENIA